MNLELQAIISVSAILFAVIDIIGSIPIIIDIKKKSGYIKPLQASIVAFLIMILFLYLGEAILQLLGVGKSDFAIAGSLVIFFLALEMLLGIRLFNDDTPGAASVVPLAFPLIAGTGTMTTLLSLRSQYTALTIVLAIVINMVIVYLVLRNLIWVEKLLGLVGQSVLRKVFGVVLLAIAIKLFRTNAGI